ncbi:MAG: imidazole glycerol phosphate synthase subunit HisH [Verrucomicrobia bacterium]|nr:imidazole glycerol phosphate synthase subunit HisH [Verrucomicrobiota bacterium]
MTLLVINYGMGNLASVGRAFEECGANVSISEDPRDLDSAERIVLPGVGAFPDGMRNLIKAGWPEKLREVLRNPEVKLLGICLGMQLLAEVGHEVAVTPGLGFIPGTVKRFIPLNGERVPHVGWNEINAAQPHPLLHTLPEGTDFYFVHSYHFEASRPKDVLATTQYCGKFNAVVASGNIFGTQFHPEKSSKQGFQLIRNFLAL